MRIACVQTDVVFGDPTANAANAIEHLERLATQGVNLAVFPEAYLTGYCVESNQDACAIAIENPLHPDGGGRGRSATWTNLQQAVDRLNIHLVLGFAENDNGQIYNSAALLSPNQPARLYHKTHLPELGLDHFVTPGDDLPIFDIVIPTEAEGSRREIVKLGILICFDVRAPEAARVLTLKGADIIVLPTNWPTGAQVSAELLAPARAVENKVFVATCNRVGTEHGFKFIGLSKILDPSGKPLAAAQADEETVLIADLDLSIARNKRNVTVPGKHETTIFESRRPAIYGEITKLSDPTARS